MEPKAPTQTAPCRVTGFGIAGLAVALLALAAAALSPWVLHALEPESQPIDEVAVEVAGRIKDRIAARARGQEYVAPEKEQRSDSSRWYIPTVIGAGVVAMGIGVIGLAAHHDARLNVATVAVGASAIIFQYALILAGLLLLILLVGIVLSVMIKGIDLG